MRTPYALTKEMQDAFFRDVVNNRNSPHRYWALMDEEDFELIGMAGLTFIEWENRQAEISLIINPELKLKRHGTKATHLLLDQAFNYINLELVYGECYLVPGGAQDFWKKNVESYEGQWKYIRKGKYWGGEHYGTLYFDIRKDEFRKTK